MVSDPPEPPSGLRVDARRNRQLLLDAAAAAFVESGVTASTRDIAARAGVGMGTLFRHFPSRSDLVAAVYQHQVDTCAAAGPTLLSECADAREALHRWVDLFVDFLITKHGLPAALQEDADGANALHRYFVERLVPVGDELLRAASAGLGTPAVNALALMRGIGNLCIGGPQPWYEPRRLAALLVDGALASAEGPEVPQEVIDADGTSSRARPPDPSDG